MDLASGQPGEVNRIELLYAKMVNLKTLFTSYGIEILSSILLRLHPMVSAILMSFIEIIENLYALKTENIFPSRSMKIF